MRLVAVDGMVALCRHEDDVNVDSWDDCLVQACLVQPCLVQACLVQARR